MELLYNFNNLCNSILNKNAESAKLIFKLQSEKMFRLYNALENIEMMRIFLNSMNRGIYNYILYEFNISLHQQCYDNGGIMHNCDNIDDFHTVGNKIIDIYIGCVRILLSQNVHIEKAKQFIDENYNRNITLDEICDHIYVSKCYLCQLFKRSMNCTFSEYLLEKRISKAKQLLITAEIDCQAIAERCGFSSSSYFTTVFKRVVGDTPLKYRTKSTKIIS